MHGCYLLLQDPHVVFHLSPHVGDLQDIHSYFCKNKYQLEQLYDNRYLDTFFCYETLVAKHTKIFQHVSDLMDLQLW
jgi:hypothetical protein